MWTTIGIKNYGPTEMFNALLPMTTHCLTTWNLWFTLVEVLLHYQSQSTNLLFFLIVIFGKSFLMCNQDGSWYSFKSICLGSVSNRNGKPLDTKPTSIWRPLTYNHLRKRKKLLRCPQCYISLKEMRKYVYLKNKYENILRAHILFSGWNIPIYFPIGFMLQLFEMSLW